MDVKSVEGPALVSLYNLYPAATISGLPAKGFSSGEVMSLMEQIADKTLPPGMGKDWSAMSYQEKVVGNQIYYVFALAILLVYFVLTGQYSWFLPVSVILAVPLALLGTVGALIGLGIANSLYPDRIDPADRALQQERHPDRRDMRAKRAEGMEILEAAVEASRLRFRRS